MGIDTNELLAPIAADNPAGDDVSFDDVTDRIREARRADDPTLSQGEWQTELKTSDWREVGKLCEGVLRQRSKDLQVAAWLTEAAIAREGIAAAAPAFDLVAGLLDGYWEGLFPRMDGDDPEERAAKLAWFNTNVAARLAAAPLTEGPRALSLADWLVSREVENLSRQNAEAYQAALEEGKLGAQGFDAEINGQGDDFLRGMLDHAGAAQASFAKLDALVDTRLGRAAPSLDAIATALKQIKQVITRAAQARGLIGGDAVGDEESAVDATAGAHVAHAAVENGVATGSRQAALQSLRDIAAFFKRTEPHSPVSFMLGKAVAWADMPLDEWLAEVVRDDAVLAGIRDRIGAS